jgi:hypothetical protein
MLDKHGVERIQGRENIGSKDWSLAQINNKFHL